jgi:hypothetical protein
MISPNNILALIGQYSLKVSLSLVIPYLILLHLKRLHFLHSPMLTDRHGEKKACGLCNDSLHCKLQMVRDIAQAVSCRPLTAETRVRDQFSPYGVCGGKQWHWNRSLVFTCHCYSAIAPYSLLYHMEGGLWAL